jgi:hypothetical protein
VSLLSNFAGFLNSQIVEQLFNSLKNMLKFLNFNKPQFMLLSRFLLQFHSEKKNKDLLDTQKTHARE